MNHLKFLTVISNQELKHADVDKQTKELLRKMAKEIRSCASIRKDGDLVHILPEPQLMFPREYLKSHVETKWQKFARSKGIKKKSRSGLVYDEEIGEYIPRYGPYSKKNRILKSGLMDSEKTVSSLRKQRKRNIEKNHANRIANASRITGAPSQSQKK
ncbi:ribosome biogenesis regulatory protein RRS1 [Ordospora pajunii]|uniref:ribosome biogenesis regulatory protein RRS1 n=1 Tax=Ordospora pajunii TaxID=3039483 RepID=UPI0029529132|nr:ribosome biogenesis regulatory protein RRS1 [Ordospora pajunii]KAH9410902.1 ribosome biogenesis regulatory protein RRS1 [Ordospora pajunii]